MIDEPRSRGMVRQLAERALTAAAGTVTASFDDAGVYIAQVRWQFAETMPQWPHEYTVRIRSSS